MTKATSKATNRGAFSIKYQDIHTLWNLPEDAVQTLIHKYELQLLDEISDPTPLTISNFFRDNRDDHQYYYDILDGRLIEDLITLWFQSNGHTVVKNGGDADGKIERSKAKRITTAPDLKIDGKHVEVQVSRGGKRRKYHIKDTKAKKILAGENTLFFIVGIEYFTVTADDIDTSDIEYNYLYGGKKCYVIRDENIDYKLLRGGLN